KENSGSFDPYLWSEADGSLRAIRASDLSLGAPIPLRPSAATAQWSIDRGTVYWVERDAGRGPNALASHARSLPGGEAREVPLDPTIPEGANDRARRMGHDLHNDMALLHGRLADGTLIAGATSLVWVRPSGSAALSVPFETVVRAGDGIALLVEDAFGQIAR